MAEKKQRTLEIKIAYSLAELARFFGLTKGQSRRLLKSEGLPMDSTRGRKRWILAADLRDHTPRVWESITDITAARAARTAERYELDEGR